MIIELKMKPIELTQGFSKIWPTDLVFDPKWPILQFVQDLIKRNLLTLSQTSPGFYMSTV